MENYLQNVLDLLQNPESFFNVLVVLLLSVIAFFLRNILQDFKNMKEEISDAATKIQVDNVRLNNHENELKQVWEEIKTMNERIIELLKGK